MISSKVKIMDKSSYRPRVVDRLLQRQLSAMGAVLIEGPKQCGKTTTAEQVARSVLYMSSPERMGQNLQLAQVDRTFCCGEIRLD